MIGIELSELAKGVSLLEEYADDEELNECVNGLKGVCPLYLKKRRCGYNGVKALFVC